MHAEKEEILEQEPSFIEDLCKNRYTEENMSKGRSIHEELVKQGVLNDDFGSIYFGWFKSKYDFAYFKLYGSNNVCAIPGMNYKDYANEIFDESEEFVFIDGHVFWK